MREKQEFIRIIKLLKQVKAQEQGWQKSFSELFNILQTSELRGVPRVCRNQIGILLMDLTFYEPNPEYRHEGSSYYGEDELVKKISDVLTDLAKLGFDV